MQLQTRSCAPRNLELLPDVDALRALLQSLAVLDAILSPEWEYRYYSFNSRWSEGEQMGSMRNGCGDDFYALFNDAGSFFKGFAHEATMSPFRCRPNRVWPGLLEGIPAELAECLGQPAFDMEATTFCIWRRYSDESWRRGVIEFPPDADPDGSASMLSKLDGQAATYKAWADDHYERPIPLAAVRQVYAQKPLTDKLVKRLNPEVTLADLAADIEEIGYPAKGAAEQGATADRPRE